jgi:hypothetical protein
MNVLSPGWRDHGSRSFYDKYLKLWSQDLSSSQASSEFDHVLEVYWSLANLVSNIKDRHSVEPKFGKFTELLATAKIGRECGNLESLKEVWDCVVALWLHYLHDHDAFESKIADSILASSVYR